jgi:cell division protein FtsW (lipid II flippase)
MSYETQWNEYRKLSKQFLWAWLGFLPGMAVIGVSVSKFIETESPAIMLAVLWLFVCAVTAVRLGLWKRPRCGNRFAMKGSYRNSATDCTEMVIT